MEAQRQKLRFLVSKFAGSIKEKADNDHDIRCFTKKQMRSMTNNYNTVLGKGGFSVVYKGRLDDGRPVAVKKYNFSSKKKDFAKEVIIQSQFSHKNIVKLLGCCVEADAPMLVTEFVPNGNLSDLLHGLNRHRVPLSLNRRLQIATDVAEALVYMHTSQSHPILHGDIKSENIFLENYMPKLSDFGLSRLLSMSSQEYTGYVIGSMGYVDPVFCQTGCLTTKSDVYSFGVILLELLARKKAIDDNKNFLGKTFRCAHTKSIRHELLDKEIAITDEEVLDDIVNLALERVKFEIEERPEMRDVYECLRKIQRTQEVRRQEIISSFQQSGFERIITKEQINKMTTNSFKSNNPTTCFMGKIFRGTSGEVQYLAMEMSFNVHGGVLKEFSRQMILYSEVNHENIIKFEGCCIDGDSPILVYESANVTLHDILFGDGSINCTINSEGRLSIAISIAKGLSYLHSLGIVHGDVRTANILLMNDIPENGILDDVRIKVSGIGASVYFSMAKDAHERMKIEENNNGYLDPRFLESGALSEEADVYSLGVVLLELFTGKMVSNHIIRNCPIEELWDQAVRYEIDEVSRGIIFRCLDPDISQRPTLTELILWFGVPLEYRILLEDLQEISANRRRPLHGPR